MNENFLNRLKVRNKKNYVCDMQKFKAKALDLYHPFLNNFLEPAKNKKETGEQDIHYGFICDGCQNLPIRGIRYKCSKCPDYNICVSCMKKKVHKKHIMEPITEPILFDKGK